MRTAVWDLSGMRPFSKIIALWEGGWQQLFSTWYCDWCHCRPIICWFFTFHNGWLIYFPGFPYRDRPGEEAVKWVFLLLTVNQAFFEFWRLEFGILTRFSCLLLSIKWHVRVGIFGQTLSTPPLYLRVQHITLTPTLRLTLNLTLYLPY